MFTLVSTINRRHLSALFLATASIGLIGCEATTGSNSGSMFGARSSTQAPATRAGEFIRVYSYYPNEEVYYSSQQDTYYWPGNDGWESGAELPAGITLSSSTCRVLSLYTDRPYHEHDRVQLEYPGTDAVVAVVED